MNRIFKLSFVFILATTILLSVPNNSFAKNSTEIETDLSKYSIVDQGKWIDARANGSYYAHGDTGYLMRGDDGRMYVGYCSSGESFNVNYAPDWRTTTKFATDRARQNSSADNGKTWSAAKILIKANTVNGQENLFQAACWNSLIFSNGYYYLYFENYTKYPNISRFDSGLNGTFVARSVNPSGPFEVYTVSGWKLIPTASEFKPILKSYVLTQSGGEDYVSRNFDSLGFGISGKNRYYGAGTTRATTKNGVIYLYYIDDTYFAGWNDSEGNFYPYVNPPSVSSYGYQTFSTSTNPTVFNNEKGRELLDTANSTLWEQFDVKYSPELNSFITFQIKEIGNSKEKTLVYRTSVDGKSWSNTKTIGKLPSIYNDNTILGGIVVSDNKIQVSDQVRVLADKNGNIKLSDLYLTITKKYLLNSPTGYSDNPSWRWYYGNSDIYGIKLVPRTPIASYDCSANASSTKIGTSINWTANVAGGVPPYQYYWSDVSGVIEPQHSGTVSRTYTTSGQKTMGMAVIDSINNKTPWIFCNGSVNVVEKSEPFSTTTPERPILLNENRPIGYLDGIVDQSVLSGWAVDKDDMAKSIDVHVYIDGPAGNGTYIGSANANILRPDLSSVGVTGSHGYNFQIPQQYIDGKTHRYYVYGIDLTPNSANPSLTNSSMSLTIRQPDIPLRLSSCLPSSSSVNVESNVVWSAVVVGGVAPYHYYWSDVSGVVNTTDSGHIGRSYTSVGKKYMSIAITDAVNNKTEWSFCSGAVDVVLPNGGTTSVWDIIRSLFGL
jgi:hypothetical protein